MKLPLRKRSHVTMYSALFQFCWDSTPSWFSLGSVIHEIRMKFKYYFDLRKTVPKALYLLCVNLLIHGVVPLEVITCQLNPVIATVARREVLPASPP